ncbi:hypothetical protein [Agathobacter sp.]|jgi:hypothetical protein|uniref:hypothetical protein n=1 Tax=Agathobacter sp. TaxID=2021311 RepID=UPI00205347CA|nr:hypothetical protein [Agathobacter sp.]DAH92952.1 MAG TPA: hypothetical protein [Caudoviricetes sp.]
MHKWAKQIMECVKAKVDGIGIDNFEGQNLDDLKDFTEIVKNIVEFDKEYLIVEAMENSKDDYRRYTEPPYYHMPVNYNDMEYMRDMDKSRGKMYYSEPIAPHVSESNYDRAKRHYTETKEMHKGASTEDKEHKMKALDMYIRELSGDISELLNDMTPDERNLLRTKMSNLASKL